MANFDALYSKLDELDASVQAVEDKLSELADDVDQSDVDAVLARVTAAKDSLDAAIKPEEGVS